MTEREFERGCIPGCVDEATANIKINHCCNKLNVYDWLGDINDPLIQNKYVEVRFKNTRKGIYENTCELD
ncbi:MAG: hypothetical protein PHE56_13680, partial [Bacteroidales bacterium]|nr:hypothetical protein [Bacteroidales bacterium]